jgi:hypothetical protein
MNTLTRTLQHSFVGKYATHSVLVYKDKTTLLESNVGQFICSEIKSGKNKTFLHSTYAQKSGTYMLYGSSYVETKTKISS